MAKLGASIGIIMLNLGVIVWFFENKEISQNNRKIASEIISASLILLFLSLSLYVW